MNKELIKRILVAADFSPASDQAFAFSLKLAKQLRAEVIAVFVKNADDLAITMRQNMQILRREKKLKQKVKHFIDSKFQALVQNAKNHHKVRLVIAEGKPWQEILKLAKKHKVDLIVTGTRSRSAISKLLLGSTAQKLLVNSPYPVITLNASHPRAAGNL